MNTVTSIVPFLILLGSLVHIAIAQYTYNGEGSPTTPDTASPCDGPISEYCTKVIIEGECQVACQEQSPNCAAIDCPVENENICAVNKSASCLNKCYQIFTGPCSLSVYNCFNPDNQFTEMPYEKCTKNYRACPDDMD